MNQFKKAKQKALESGHQLENITDLKTAGIAQTTESVKTTESQKTKEVVEISVPEQTLPSTQTKQEPQSQNVLTSKEEERATVETTYVPANNVAPIIKQSPIVEEMPDSNIAVAPISEPVYTKVEEVAVEIPVQAIEPTPVPVQVTPVPVVTEVPTYTTPVVSQVVNAPKAATTKKNIPNIFAPKNEAKSMRKSLVLKPTSVKIAENYCAKNGGSFNELIQTLLDNFIDEYGL